MTLTHKSLPPVRFARAAMTQDALTRTGLNEATLATLVHDFYARIRSDPVPGPIFAERISDWQPHLAKMVDFWSSVALMTGRYRGSPVPKHAVLPVSWEHFERWLDLFEQTANEVCSSAGAAHVVERAKRIARSLHMASQGSARGRRDAVPALAETRALLLTVLSQRFFLLSGLTTVSATG